MKISKRKIESLVAEAIKKTVLKEVKANNWQEYVNVGKTEADRQERRKLWMMWELWTKGDSKASFALMDATLPVNPTEYTGDYGGWVEWYKDMVKNKEAMASMGRKNNFNVDDHFKYVDKYFPNEAKLPTMKIQKMNADQQVVDNFIQGLNALEKEPKFAKLDLPGKDKDKKDLALSSEPSRNIFGFDEKPKAKGKTVTRAQSIEGYLLTQAIPPASLPLDIRNQYPKQSEMYKKNPSLFHKLAKGESLTSDEEAAYAKLVGKDASTRIAGGEPVKESKHINENRIRAIIRHELIQSMKK